MKKVPSPSPDDDSRRPEIPYKVWRFGRSLAFVCGCACLLAAAPDSRSSPLLLVSALVMALRWHVSHRYLAVNMTVRESAMGGILLGVTALSLLWQSFRSLMLHQPNDNCVGIYVFLGWASSYFTGEALAMLVLSVRLRSTVQYNTGDGGVNCIAGNPCEPCGPLILKGTAGVEEEDQDEEVGQDTVDSELDIVIADEGSFTPSALYATDGPDWGDAEKAYGVSREATVQQENNKDTVIDILEHGGINNNLSGQFPPGYVLPLVEGEGEHGLSNEISCVAPKAGGTYQVQALVVTDPYGEQGAYTGSISNATNMPHGYGRLEYDRAGRWYEGDWKYGRWTGTGRLSNGDGDSYEGGLKNDHKHGFGIMKFADGRIFEGEYMNGQMMEGKMTYENGSTYTGSWVDGMRHGRGRCDFPDHSTYEGEFQAGEFFGYGKMIWGDGCWYEGKWAYGDMDGWGKEVKPDGTLRHEGEWRKGKPIRT